jgi:hypothetical protein
MAHVPLISVTPAAPKHPKPALPPHNPVLVHGTVEEEALLEHFKDYYRIPVAPSVTTKEYVTSTRVDGAVDHMQHGTHFPPRDVYAGKSVGAAYEIWFQRAYDTVRNEVWAKDAAAMASGHVPHAIYVNSVGLGRFLQPIGYGTNVNRDVDPVEPSRVQLFQLLAQQKIIDGERKKAQAVPDRVRNPLNLCQRPMIIEGYHLCL